MHPFKSFRGGNSKYRRKSASCIAAWALRTLPNRLGWGSKRGKGANGGEPAIKFQAAMICRKMPLWPCKLRREQREAATVIIPVCHENNDDNKLDYCSTFCQSLKGQCHDISNPYFFLTILSGPFKNGVKQIGEDNRSQSSKFACPRTVNDYVNTAPSSLWLQQRFKKLEIFRNQSINL